MPSRAYIERDSGRVFDFGPFRLNEDERLLLRDGEPVPLTPKVFDTLALLIQNSGHLVDKDELMRMIWPDSFVEEANLNRAISTLRRALGETPNEPSYIETVPKRGYRFIATVTEASYNQCEPLSRGSVPSAVLPRTGSDGDLGESRFEPMVSEASGKGDTVQKNHSRLLSRRAVAFVGMIALATAVLLYLGLTNRLAGIDKTPKVREVNSLAVLPFRALGVTEQEEYLELGMTDVLITTLSNIKEINVRPTSAVLRYAKTEQNPVEIGRVLKVDAILEGSIQKVGDRIRVTVRLLNVNKDAPLWAGKFDEPAADVLKVQESIAERVARALSANLHPAEEEAVTKRYTRNVEAYHFYLKGRYFWNKRTMQDYNKAIQYYELAISKDPGYALAYAGLADAHSLVANDSSDHDRDESYERAKAAALKALELDYELAEAHTSLAWIKRVHEWDWPGAEREFKRAIELNPNSADSHQWYALLLTTVGRTEEAISEVKRAQELDPLSVVISANAFAVFFYARQFDQAIAQCRQMLELDPVNLNAHGGLISVYLQKGMYEEALAEIQKSMPKENSITVSALYGRLYAHNGQNDKVPNSIEYLKQAARRQSGAFYYLAMVYTDLGEKDRAFDCLQKAYQLRDARLVWIKPDPRFDKLRSDPRFDELLKDMKLTQ
jgi:DNA-binding winged helix-turn-helix (wHTH) protein/TolB-like protein/Tfp pilus assembly protein PilF